MNPVPYQTRKPGSLLRALIWLLLALTLGVLALAAGAQEPDPNLAAYFLQPKPKPHLGRVEWSLLASDASIRSLDMYSTKRMLDQGNRERLLPMFVAGHPAVMGLAEGADVAGQWWVARRLSTRRPRLVHAITAIDLVTDAPCAVRNLLIGAVVWLVERFL